MTFKEQLVQEIESMTEGQLEAALAAIREIKLKKVKLPSRKGSGQSVLRHAGRWVGNDLKDCLQAVYDSRGLTEF